MPNSGRSHRQHFFVESGTRVVGPVWRDGSRCAYIFATVQVAMIDHGFYFKEAEEFREKLFRARYHVLKVKKAEIAGA